MRTATRRSAAARAIASLTLVLVGALGPASAQQERLQSYDVELVIFRHLSDAATPESWRLEGADAGANLTIPDEEPSASAPPGDAVAAIAASFPALPAARRQLTAIDEALRRSRDYRPIAHIGWTQPGYTRSEARFFPISTLVPESAGLGGRIALSRGRYLHLTLDLSFATPEAPSERFVLQQTRRMRSNERHYIDHPKFGVIAVITPAGE